MLKHYVNNHTAETGNWHISPGRWSAFAMEHNNCDKSQQVLSRTFTIPANPKTSLDPHPKHWKAARKFNVPGGLDSLINCGIPSHAFYLAALEFKGHTWETIGKIWYGALTDSEFALPENQTFLSWKRLTVKHYEKIFGARARKSLRRRGKVLGFELGALGSCNKQVGGEGQGRGGKNT